MARLTQVSVITLVAACWLSAAGCSSSNEPSGGSTAGTTATGSAGTGTVAQGGSSAGTNPTGVSGSVGIAGTSSSAGGSTGTAGTTGTGTGGGSFGMPSCTGLTTAAAGNPAPTKAGVCTDADPQLCYKTCGPQSVGVKSETCTNGAYVEQSGCTFAPDLDASCYKIPTTVDASCPTTTPAASSACTVAPCTPCNVGGNYLDSTGASKVGYCVCPAPGASGTSKWSCASTTAWPCPAGMGC